MSDAVGYVFSSNCLECAVEFLKEHPECITPVSDLADMIYETCGGCESNKIKIKGDN